MTRWYAVFGYLGMHGWRHRHFLTEIRSEIEAATFGVRFNAFWRCRTNEAKSVVVSAVHDRLVCRATSALSTTSVFCPDSAFVRLLGAISRIEGQTPNGAPLEIRASAKLWIPTASLESAIQRRRDSFAWKMQLEGEHNRLEYMRDVVLGDPVTGRTWWLLQKPELISAVGNSLFVETLEAATAARISGSGDGDSDHLVKVLADFMHWLDSGDGRAEMAYDLFDALLRTLQQDDLRSRLNAVRSINRVDQ